MHPSLQFLDEALRIAEEELLLLNQDDLDGLEDSAKARSELVQRAWMEKDGCDQIVLTCKLTAMQSLQHRLQQKAEHLISETRSALNQDKKNQRGILGYCRTGLGGSENEPRMFRKFS
ncbi:MAG: hypothetical protein FWG17_04645 [Desulfovibrionaceae bacterium]|nr:hypothetical protein [Desulfovibrionaceae bacterium]